MIAGVFIGAGGSGSLALTDDKTIPIAVMIGGGLTIAIGVLIAAIGITMSEGYVPKITSRPIQRASQ